LIGRGAGLALIGAGTTDNGAGIGGAIVIAGG
jgi:hypothetical protein